MVVPADKENIHRAAELIRSGELVAFPTETVYGLGADATNAEAVARIFEVKRRPAFDPLIVHIGNPHWLTDLVETVPEAARQMIRQFWPGPLTIVLRKREIVPDIVTAGLPSIGVRMPDHEVALALLHEADLPIAAPSANLFGSVSPTSAGHVAEQLGNKVAMILDGGPCRIGLESTIVSFLSTPPALLRPGAITREEIEGLIGPINFVPDALRPLAPGQLPRHYAPATPLTLVSSLDEIPAQVRPTAALLLIRPVPRMADLEGFARVELLAPDGNLRRAAAGLFAALRNLDRASYTQIFALRIDEHDLGLAIMDRLRRAGAPRYANPS